MSSVVDRNEYVAQAEPGFVQSYSSASNPVTEQQHGPPKLRKWTQYEKILFRVAFIFFIAICIPNSVEWYKQVIQINWTNLHYRDLYDIARFGSGINFFGNTIFGNTLLGYANWIITLAIAIIGGLVWTAIVRLRKKEVNNY